MKQKSIAVTMSGSVKVPARGGSANRTRKVAVALSGGVDSGVAAALVVKAGYKAAGFHMHLWVEPTSNFQLSASNPENKCCSTESLEAARKTAHKLGIPFYIVDFEEIFKKRVVDYFLKEYAVGRTPNPCVMCNRFIKFGELMDYAKKIGYEFLVTGHYARVAANNAYRLLQARDHFKDQSYFLYNLTQKQLAQVMFPVGDFLKKEVVVMAKKWQLPVAERPESQEICFFPESDYQPFLKRQIPEKLKPGEVVDTKGRTIGKHLGLPLYTIGQRHGFEIRPLKERYQPGLIPPFYVIGKDIGKNQLIVGFGKETERKEFWVEEINWLRPIHPRGVPQAQHHLRGVRVRLRHQGELLRARVETPARCPNGLLGGGGRRVKVVLDEPQRGIAPGQAAVFYSKYPTRKTKHPTHEVLGGGIIEE